MCLSASWPSLNMRLINTDFQVHVRGAPVLRTHCAPRGRRVGAAVSQRAPLTLPLTRALSAQAASHAGRQAQPALTFCERIQQVSGRLSAAKRPQEHLTWRRCGLGACAWHCRWSPLPDHTSRHRLRGHLLLLHLLQILCESLTTCWKRPLALMAVTFKSVVSALICESLPLS